MTQDCDVRTCTRIPQGQIPKAALRWTATDKRKRRTLKTTWPRTVLSELKEMGVTWRETDEAAQDRVK